MDPVDPLALARQLIDIDSTTGREQDVAAALALFLRDRGYSVFEQPLDGGRVNIIAAERIVASGLAMFFPANCGAVPCEGWNNPCSSPSSADGARPRPPTMPAPKSESMSPNWFSITSTSN